MSGGWPQFFARARARPTIAPNFQFASDAYATDINALTTYTGNNLDENKVCAGSNQRSDALYVYSDACAQKKKHLYRPTTGTQTLAQTSSAIVSLYMKYYSQIYCSPRQRKSKIGHSHNRTKAYSLRLSYFFPKMAYYCLCSG